MTSTNSLRPENFSALLDEIAEVQTSLARMQARESELYAACADYALLRAESETPGSSDSEVIWRSTAMEVGATLHISDRAASARMNTARTVVEDFPAVRDAWSRGEITRAHVTAIVREGTVIESPDARARFSERILEIAVDETPARTAGIARVMASRVEPEVIVARQQRAVCERHIRVADVDDGMSVLTALLPATLAHGIFDRLTQAAKLTVQAERRAQRDARALAEADITSDGPAIDLESGDTGVSLPRVRRTDEVRADLLADLLLTGVPSAAQLPEGADGIDLGGIRGHVQVIVTADALFGDSTDAPVIAGGGAIPLEQARALAAQTPTWDRLTVDPHLNTLLAVESYRPSEAQRRLLNALDEHCRQSGCTRLAMWCDIDHSHDFALGGATEIVNLANLCEAHHVLKHADGWTIHRLPDGTLVWTSRHGRCYPDKPRPAVAFMFSATDAPF